MNRIAAAIVLLGLAVILAAGIVSSMLTSGERIFATLAAAGAYCVFSLFVLLVTDEKKQAP